MYKYLNQTEKRKLKQGLKEILAIKLISNMKDLELFYNGELDYKKAILFFKRFNTIKKGISNHKLKNIPEEVMMNYFEEGKICSKEEFNKFSKRYKPRYSTSSAIIEINDIINDCNYNDFYEGKLSYSDAIILYLKMSSQETETNVFADRDYIMARYCEVEYKGITVSSNIQLSNIISVRKSGMNLNNIVRCVLLANTFNYSTVEMLNLSYLHDELTLSYEELKKLFDLVDGKSFTDYYENKLSKEDAINVYQEIRDNRLLAIICPDNNKVIVSYLSNDIGVKYEEMVKNCYDIDFYCGTDERQDNENSFLEVRGEFEGYQEIAKCISKMTNRLIDRNTIYNSFTDLLMTDIENIEDFEVYKDIYSQLGDFSNNYDQSDEDTFYDQFYDEVGEEAAIIVIKDFQMNQPMVFNINRLLPYSEYTCTEAYGSDNSTYIIMGESVILAGLPVEVIIEIAISLIGCKKIN